MESPHAADLELELSTDVDVEPVAASLTAALPEGIDVTGVARIADRAPALQEAVSAVQYRFEIVVASFHTEARAASVAADVSSLGLPVRRQTASGWQQVIAGPFASRAEADDAQQRLAVAGLTQTVLTSR